MGQDEAHAMIVNEGGPKLPNLDHDCGVLQQRMASCNYHSFSTIGTSNKCLLSEDHQY